MHAVNLAFKCPFCGHLILKSYKEDHLLYCKTKFFTTKEEFLDSVDAESKEGRQISETEIWEDC